MSEARKELPVLYCFSAWSIKGNSPHFGVLYLEAEQIKSFFLRIITASSCLNERPGARETFEYFRKHIDFLYRDYGHYIQESLFQMFKSKIPGLQSGQLHKTRKDN